MTDVFASKSVQSGDPPRPKVLAGVLLLVVGLAGSGFVLYSLAQDLAIWLLGRHVQAQVVDSWAELTSERDAPVQTFQYFIRYGFQTPDGQTITKTTRVSATEWAGLGSGRQGRPSVDSLSGESVGPAAPVYQEQVHVPQTTLGGIEEGATISVVYFPPLPSHNRLDETSYIPLLACTYLPLLLGSVLALIAGWRLAGPKIRRRKSS